MRRPLLLLLLLTGLAFGASIYGPIAKLGTMDESLFPTPGTIGALLYGTDAGTVYVDNGTAWGPIASGSATAYIYGADLGPAKLCYLNSIGASTQTYTGIGVPFQEGLTVTGSGPTYPGSTSTQNGSSTRWLSQPNRASIQTGVATANSRVAAELNTTSGKYAYIYNRQLGFAWYFRIANSRYDGVTGPVGQSPSYFFGLRDTLFDAGCAPSTFVNTIYVGCDAAEDNLSVCSNDASGSATCTSLGSNFKCRNGHTFMDISFIADPTDTSRVEYYIRNVETGDLAQGFLTSDLPATDSFLGFGFQGCNNGDGGLPYIGWTGFCSWTP